MPDRSELSLDAGERVRYRAALRRGGEIAVSDRRVLVASDDQVISIPFANISEVTHEAFDWFIAIVSVALVLFGLYSLDQHLLVAGAFVVVGLWSLVRTYRKRHLVRIHTHAQPKPVEVFPENVDGLYGELEPAMERFKDGESDAPDD